MENWIDTAYTTIAVTFGVAAGNLVAVMLTRWYAVYRMRKLTGNPDYQHIVSEFTNKFATQAGDDSTGS